MDKSPSWEANNNNLTSQEYLCRVQDPKVSTVFTTAHPLVSILSQINPVHTLPSWFFKIHFNIFLSKLRSSNWSLKFQVFRLKLYAASHPSHLISSHLILFDLAILKTEECSILCCIAV
jgi:hypothetical protein